MLLKLAAAADMAAAARPGLPLGDDPSEVVMLVRSASGLPKGNGRYWARTSDPQLVELVLSQLS
jgi:hypothetical protein